MANRRDFILRIAAASGALAVQASQLTAASRAVTTRSKPLRILMLGATGFIGPHFVAAAVARGHAVSVLLHDKGKGDANLPPGAEPLLGDRNGDLKSIVNRDWDAVFDLATYVPNWVRTLGEALKGRVRHYTFVSTISVYADPAASDEGSALAPYTDSADPYSLTARGKQYGPLKVLCEREAQQQFPDRTLVLRPGHLIGPGEKVGAFTYLPARMERGGEILAAGTPLDPVQFIDVRDLADWALHMAEQSEIGTFNTTGPDLPIGWGEMLGAIRGTQAVPLTLTWVPLAWVTKQVVGYFNPFVFWPAEVGSPGLNRIRIDKARAKGLSFRPLSTTALDTLAWYKAQPASRQREALLGFGVHAALDDIMTREKGLLAQWQAEQQR
jgi:2'-hydroxyisoflavone reductase